MNYTPLFTLAARTETAYNTAQSFMANECPVLEQRLTRAFLTAAVTVLEFTLTIIDWLTTQTDKRHEYALRMQLWYVLAKRFLVRQGIAAARFNERYGLTAKASKAWSAKGAITTSAMDKVFSLN